MENGEQWRMLSGFSLIRTKNGRSGKSKADPMITDKQSSMQVTCLFPYRVHIHIINLLVWGPTNVWLSGSVFCVWVTILFIDLCIKLLQCTQKNAFYSTEYSGGKHASCFKKTCLKFCKLKHWFVQSRFCANLTQPSAIALHDMRGRTCWVAMCCAAKWNNELIGRLCQITFHKTQLDRLVS